VDFIAKPTQDLTHAMETIAAEIQAKVKAAAHARVGGHRGVKPVRPPRQASSAAKIIAIGASTGGVEALKLVLTGIPAGSPPVLITQHMPPRFTASFAERLNKECPMTISEAVHDEPVEPGHVYI